jgi:hypothetical protein
MRGLAVAALMTCGAVFAVGKAKPDAKGAGAAQ